MSKNIKQLTPNELKKQLKKLDATDVMTIILPESQDEYKIEYDLHFKVTKQIHLVENFMKFIETSREHPDNLEYTSQYIALLAIKYFTNLQVPDEISDQMAYLAMLLNLKILDKIADNLPEKQMQELYEMLTRTMDGLAKASAELRERAEKEAAEIAAEMEKAETEKTE